MQPEIVSVRESILRARGVDRTTIHVIDRLSVNEPCRSITKILDAFVETLGFVGIGSSWKEIDRLHAQAIAKTVLCRDLAYNCEVMEAKRAHKLTDQFLTLFDDDSRHFTNSDFNPQRLDDTMKMWTAITKATFDTGIICVDNKRIGILWVEDED